MKKQMNRLLAMALSLILVVSMFPRTAFAATAVENGIAATISDVDFGVVDVGYSEACINPTIINTGTANFDLVGSYAKIALTAGDTDAFTIGWNGGGGEIAPGQSSNSKPYIWCKENLAVGEHSATLTLYYDYDASGTDYDWEAVATSTVKIKVVSELTPHDVTVVGGISDKATAVEGQTVTITANPAPEGKIFDKWTTEDGVVFQNAGAETTTFVMPDKDVSVTANYTEPPLYAATLSSHDFGTAKEGYTAEDSGSVPRQAISIKNTGNQPLSDPKVEITGGDKDAFAISAEAVPGNINAGDTNTNFRIGVKAGLTEGTYEATITLTAAELETPVTATVKFVVEKADPVIPDVFSATLSSHDFGTAKEGYSASYTGADVQRQFVTIENTGNQALSNPYISLAAGDVDAFAIGAEAVPGNINAGDKNTNFFVAVKEGLKPGTYEATITLTAAELKEPVTATVKLVVTESDELDDVPPQTGDTSNLPLWGTLCMISVCAIVALSVLKKKRVF